HQLAWINLESTASINTTVTGATDYGSAELTSRQNGASGAQNTGWGLIATGDTASGSAVSPSVNHKGDTIVYTFTDDSQDGHPDTTAKAADIKTVPYNNSGNHPTGGTATPLAGASDPGFLEYYPSFSADDAFIAFTQAPAVSASSPDGPYYNRFGKVMVIP